MTFDVETGTVLSVAAVLVSAVSAYLAGLAYRQANRPVVTAIVAEHAAGTDATAFDLIVSNTGNRPATHVRLHASRADLLTLLDGEASAKRVEIIERNFLADSLIPVLRNGEHLTTSFGAFTSVRSDTKRWLRYGAQIEVSISYRDLEGRRFESRQPLKIYARDGFGGGIWA